MIYSEDSENPRLSAISENPSNSTNLSNSNWKKGIQDHAFSKSVLLLKSNQEKHFLIQSKNKKVWKSNDRNHK